MLRVFLAFLFLALAAPTTAQQFYVSGLPGRAQENLGGETLAPAYLINQFNALGPSFANAADAGILDSFGYPTQAPSGTITLTGGNGMWSGQTWILSWPATRTFTVSFLNTLSSCVATNATVTGCTGATTTISSQSGLAGSVTFVVAGGGATSTWTITFPTTGTYAAGSGQLALYRQSDQAAYLAGKFWTPEFESTLTAMRPRAIRPMGWVNSGAANWTNQSQWKYRQTPSDLTWSQKYPPGAWAGTITVSNNQYTASPAPDTPLTGWVDGEVLIGVSNGAATAITISNIVNNGSGLCRLTVSSTTGLSNGQAVWPVGYSPISLCGGAGGDNRVSTYTLSNVNGVAMTVDLVGSTFSGGTYTSGGQLGTATLTVTGKSGGAVFIASNFGIAALAAGDTLPAGLISCVYKSVLNAAICTANIGVSAMVPIEAQVQLANDIGSGLWGTIPILALDSWVTSWASYVNANINSNNPFYAEYSNEVWNFGFPQTGLANSLGEDLGWAASSNQATYGWYSLRVRQIMGNIIPPVWTSKKTLRRVLAYQAAGDTTNLTNRMQGSQLTPTIGNQTYCTYTGGTWSGSCSGGANYSASPNRPADVVETFGLAPYAQGANLCTAAPDAACSTSQVSATWLQGLINTWQASNTSGAIALVDSDFRTNAGANQTVTASGTTFTTPSAHNFNANNSTVWFTVAGGTTYSGITTQTPYRVDTTPTSNTFTIKALSGGQPTGSDINAGSAGSGTTTVNTGGFNFFVLGSTWVAFGEFLASQFDASRPAGMNPIRVEWYEGALEPVGPTDAQCTTLGLTATGDCSTTIFNAVQAWRNDPTSASTIQEYYNSLLGLDASFTTTYGLLTHSHTPANLVLPGPATNPNAPYSLLSNSLPNSTPYYLYNGFGIYSGALPATP